MEDPNSVEARGHSKTTFSCVALITGEQRSGTTLISRYLDAQPGVAIASDYLHIDRYFTALDIQSVRDHLTDARKRNLLRHYARDTSALGFLVAFSTDEFESLLDFYQLALERVGERSPVVGHKTTRAYTVLPQLLAAIPELKIVFVVRDPRAVVPSAQRWRKRNKPKRMVAAWRESAEALRTLEEDPVNRSRVLAVRYEDFVRATNPEAHRLGQFLGLDQVETDVELSERGQPWRGNSSYSELTSTIDTAPLDRWREEDSELIAFVERNLRDEMERLGYQPVGR